MQVTHNALQVKTQCQQWRDTGLNIAFVPTMGCLHQGHLSLVEKAADIADKVVVSIFVNPLQFNNADDLANYPHTLETDLQQLKVLKVDMVFTPEVADLYPEGEAAVVPLEPGPLADILEGEHRPGHFAGVVTVVKRLFDIVMPHSAIFGEKDLQQLLVIEAMVARFDLPIAIIGMPTCRESDGLAMSSRNGRLSTAQRRQAVHIYRQMQQSRDALLAGETDIARLEQRMQQQLQQLGFEPEYCVIRRRQDLQPVKDHDEKMVILVAARLGTVRLIDNLSV